MIFVPMTNRIISLSPPHLLLNTYTRQELRKKQRIKSYPTSESVKLFIYCMYMTKWL